MVQEVVYMLETIRTRFKRTYESWSGMKARCNNPTNHAYKNYGARGVTVCDEWNQDYPLGFETFLKDMGPKPEGLTLERVSVHEGYFPHNCMWISKADQNRNKQYHRMVEFNGKSKPLFQWVGEFNLNYYTVHARLRKGYSPEEALFGTRARKTKGNTRHARHKAEILDVILPETQFTRKDIMLLTGKDRETVGEALRMLVQDGELEEVAYPWKGIGGAPKKYQWCGNKNCPYSGTGGRR